MSTVGIVGVGEIAAAVVDGLCGDPARPAPRVVLSPRGAPTAAALAARHPGVEVAATNAAVAEAADLLLLTVRRPALADALRGVRVAPGTVVVSALADATLAELRTHVGDDVALVRAIPVPAVRERRGVTAIVPDHPAARALFDPLGGTLALPGEPAFAALLAATGTVSAHLAAVAAVVRWATEQGVDAPTADRYLRDLFAGLATSLGGREPLADLLRAHETPGGLNEQHRRAVVDEAALGASLDALLRRVRP